VKPKPVQVNSGRSRIDRLRLSFSKLRVDAFLVTHLPNVQYLCGFSGSAGALLVETSRCTLITDSRYTFQAREEVSDANVHIAKHGLLRGVAETLGRHRKRFPVAYGPSRVTVTQKATLQALGGPQVRWVGDGDAVERLRAVKDPGELVLMREAAKLISDVFAGALPEIKPGIAELTLAAEI
jgi:Xaa-Pro aminopeptidase